MCSVNFLLNQLSLRYCNVMGIITKHLAHNLHYLLQFNFYFNTSLFILKLTWFVQLLNDFRKFFLKKYFYTINHKRIALNYLYFCI